jgi:LysR family transcriptional activator of nhaA
MFNYNHLYYFYMTAKSGGVTVAAKALRIAQPSLSSQLRVLEGAVDRKLFHKVGRHMELTHDGEVAYGYCRKIFESAEEYADVLNQTDQSRGPRVRIGVTDEIERPFITDLVSAIVREKEMSKQPMVSMYSEPHAELLGQLQTRQIDLLLSNQSAYGEDLQVLASVEMPVALIISPKLLKGIKVSREASVVQLLKTLPGGLVLPTTKLRLRSEIDLFLQKQHVQKQVVFESDILAAVIRAVIDGAGIGFIPFPYVAREINHGTLKSFGPEGGYWKNRLLLISLKKKELDPMIKEFRDAVLKIDLGLGKSPKLGLKST